MDQNQALLFKFIGFHILLSGILGWLLLFAHPQFIQNYALMAVDGPHLYNLYNLSKFGTLSSQLFSWLILPFIGVDFYLLKKVGRSESSEVPRKIGKTISVFIIFLIVAVLYGLYGRPLALLYENTPLLKKSGLFER
jgi:hypothetical protein